MSKSPTPDRRGIAPILCAIDESEPSETALRVATSLAAALARPLHLVHVWTGAVATFAERKSRRFLDDAARDVKARAAHFEIGVVETGLEVVAERVNPWLVVMGTHSRGRIGRFLLGSTAHEILSRARWPLLVVRAQTPWPPARIVLGVDSSEAAAHAGDLAASISAAFEAPMTLVEAAPELLLITARQDPRGVLATTMVKRIQSHLDERAAVVAAAGCAATRTTVRLVKPERALADAVKQTRSALVVVGHRSSLERRETDDVSVAESLVENAHASVLIYPDDAVVRAPNPGSRVPTDRPVSRNPVTEVGEGRRAR